MSKVTVVFTCNNKLAPLYLHYSGQCNAQPAYVSMDEDGEINASTDGEIGNSMPSSVWHNRTLRFKCPNDVSGSVLSEYLNSKEAMEKFQAIHDMHCVEWNGNNHVGKFLDDDEKELISNSIESDLEELECTPIWNAIDLIDSSSIKQLWKGDWETTLAELKDDSMYVIGDLKECIIEQAQYEYYKNGISCIPESFVQFIEIDED